MILEKVTTVLQFVILEKRIFKLFLRCRNLIQEKKVSKKKQDNNYERKIMGIRKTRVFKQIAYQTYELSLEVFLAFGGVL